MLDQTSFAEQTKSNDKLLQLYARQCSSKNFCHIIDTKKFTWRLLQKYVKHINFTMFKNL